MTEEQTMHMGTMRVQGRDLAYERAMIPVDDCILDPKNPRVQTLVGVLGDGVTDQQLHDLIWEKDRVKALAEAVFQNGGVREHLLVQRVNGKYLVREGNCREVAARHLQVQYPGDDRFSKVPAWIFDDGLREEDIAVILADMHVAGKLQWPVYEQAKHVWDLHEKYQKPYDWLAIHLRLSKSKISQLLDAYRAMEEFLDTHKDSDIRKFSFFAELMKKPVLRKRYCDDSEFKEFFQSWVSTGRLTDSRDVRQLVLILDNPDALQALSDNGFKAALDVLHHADPSLSSDLYAAIKAATRRLREASAAEINELKAGTTPQKIILLRELHRATQDLATLSGTDL